MPIRISGSTGISGLDGSATTPVLQGASANSGIYYSGNTVFVSTSGTNAMTIGPTGNVSFANSSVSIDGQNISSATGMRNRIINGDMKVWQRGTTFTNPAWPSTTYTADRWFVSRNYSTANCSASQQTTGVTGLGKYGLRIQRTAGDVNTTGNFYVVQHIENKNMLDLQGQTVTFSGWVKFGSNFSGSSLSVALASGTGTDENYYSGYTGSSTVCSVSLSANTSYVKFTITGTVPSNSNELAVFFGYVPSGTAGANDWFEFTDIQVERGSVATPFERRLYGTELALCQRYYYNGTFATAGTTSTTQCNGQFIFPVTMRSSPTVAAYPSGTYTITAFGTGDFTSTSPGGVSVASSVNGAKVDFGGFTGLTASRPAVFWSIPGVGIPFSSEL